MYYIRRKSDNLIQYRFDTEPEFKGYLVKPIKALDIKPETHETIQISESPPIWQGGLWVYDGTWTVANQGVYDAVLAEQKIAKAAEINTIRYSKIYMESIPYIFPGDTEPDGIQMRNETDRQNIQDFVIDASQKIHPNYDPEKKYHTGDIVADPSTNTIYQSKDDNNIGNSLSDAVWWKNIGSSMMYWMPVSNNVKAMTAAQAVEMGQYLKSRGDQIMAYSWQLKAQVNAAETIEALNAMNIQEGWPV